MYKELVEKLRDDNACLSISVLHEAANAIEDLITALTASNEVIAKSKPKWIPVTERLPEEQGWCVACVFYRGIQWGDIETKGFTSVCPAYYFEGTFHKVSSEAEVTHWMPLPEPPKEEIGKSRKRGTISTSGSNGSW